MARLWQFGAEQNTNTAGVEVTGTRANSNTLSTSPVRSGTYAHKTQAGGTVRTNYFQFNASNDNGPYYARMYMFIPASISALNTIFTFTDSAVVTRGRIRLATDNTLELWDFASKIGSSSTPLNLNQWYLVELKYFNNTVSGKLELEARLASDDGTNSVLFASTTTSTNTGGVDRLEWGSFSGVAICNISFDDLAINDSTGSFQNSYPGPGKIINLKPNATGDSNGFLAQVGGTVGSANNFTRVNEVTPDDATSYNGSAVLSAEDLFNVEDSGILVNSPINVVAVGVRMADLVGADATAAFKLEIEKTSGGTKAQSGTIIPNSTTWITNAAANPRNYPLVTYQDPDGVNWIKSTLDSMQIGYIQTAINVQTIAISTLWASVDYTPASTNNFFPFFFT